jgi:hypothetical protein
MRKCVLVRLRAGVCLLNVSCPGFECLLVGRMSSCEAQAGSQAVRQSGILGFVATHSLESKSAPKPSMRGSGIQTRAICICHESIVHVAEGHSLTDFWACVCVGACF